MHYCWDGLAISCRGSDDGSVMSNNRRWFDDNRCGLSDCRSTTWYYRNDHLFGTRQLFSKGSRGYQRGSVMYGGSVGG